MKTSLVSVIILAVAIHALAAEEGAKPNAQKEAEPKAAALNHEGVWKPIAAAMGGVRVPGPALTAITLKISGENYEVTVAGEKEPDKGVCTLDESTTPKRMTIKSMEGPNRGKTFLAIYEMKDAGSLRVCYDLSGTAFPKEFKAPKDTQLYLVGYRRQKE
jgi:uncharacterized protein (TIGR03067 family)